MSAQKQPRTRPTSAGVMGSKPRPVLEAQGIHELALGIDLMLLCQPLQLEQRRAADHPRDVMVELHRALDLPVHAAGRLTEL